MVDFLTREKVPFLVIGVLCILGIAVAAATLNTAVDVGTDGGGGEIDAPVDEIGDGFNRDIQDTNDSGGGDKQGLRLDTCIEFLQEPIGILLTFLAIFGTIGGFYYWKGGSMALLSSFGLIPMSMLLYFGLTGGCTSGAGGGDSGGLSNIGSQLVNQSQGGGVEAIPVSSELLVAVFGVVIVVSVVALFRTSGSQEIEPAPTEADEEPELSDFAEAAGRAVTRIEEAQADVDNAVYRAWIEMTELLDVPHPETSTAGEFAEAAIEFGLAESDVNQLTRLFNEVRYGEMDPEPREELALGTLRRIESSYSGSPEESDVSDESHDEAAAETSEKSNEEHTSEASEE